MIIQEYCSFYINIINMKKIVQQLVEQYLRSFPAPTKIAAYSNFLKLSYTYSTPYTNSKQVKEVFYPLKTLETFKLIESQSKRIIFNEEGRIQESQSFDSISTKQKHKKLLQDDVFGKAVQSKSKVRWAYCAQATPEPAKSYFNEGQGKKVYTYDLGELFQDVREVGIYLWDKQHKQTWRVQIDKDLIPAFPSFANEDGSEIIFHAYKKQNFGHGIIHCFNRPVSIYKASLTVITKQPNQSQPKQAKKQIKLESKVTQLFSDGHQTNIFPTLSPCGNYLAYFSGTGITHTYYMDLVIMKKKEGEWTETGRIKERFVGYYSTLKIFISKYGQETIAYTQTIEDKSSAIYRANLESGEFKNITESFVNHDFSIQQITNDGTVIGMVTTNNFNSFFYIEKDGQIQIIAPSKQFAFTEVNYKNPIPALYLEAKQQDIIQQFKERAKKRPLLLLPHGGPHGSFVSALTCLKAVLLRLGYGLLMPNFSGSVGHGKQHLERSLSNLGDCDAAQILQLLKQVLHDKPDIDNKSIHVYGGSYGGYMAAILGSRHNQHFKSAIILNGVLDIVANMWFTDIPEWNTVEALKRHSFAGLTEEHYVHMLKQSPSSGVMKIPTLQFLGAKDRRVPYRQGLLFDAITKQHGTPIETYVYQNSGHSLADSVETNIDIIIKTILFLQGVKEEDKNVKKSQ